MPFYFTATYRDLSFARDAESSSKVFGHVPHLRRFARTGGNPAFKIADCVFATLYGTRKNCAVILVESTMANEARGLRSRGCPTEPGLIRYRRLASSLTNVFPRTAVPRTRPCESTEKITGKWVWPYNTIGASVESKMRDAWTSLNTYSSSFSGEPWHSRKSSRLRGPSGSFSRKRRFGALRCLRVHSAAIFAA